MAESLALVGFGHSVLKCPMSPHFLQFSFPVGQLWPTGRISKPHLLQVGLVLTAAAAASVTLNDLAFLYVDWRMA